MTREQFVAKWQDEMTGLLMESFRASTADKRLSDEEIGKQGRAMMNQLRRAKAFLEKTYDDLSESLKPVGLPPAIAGKVGR